MKKIISFIPVLFLYLFAKLFWYIDWIIVELSFGTFAPMGIFYMHLVCAIYMNMLQDWAKLKLFNI